MTTKQTPLSDDKIGYLLWLKKSAFSLRVEKRWRSNLHT